MSPTFDHLGPLARTAQDAELMYLGMTRRLTAPLRRERVRLRGLRIGRASAQISSNAVTPAVRAGIERTEKALAAAGALFVDLELPYYETALAAFTALERVEMARLHRDSLAGSWHEYGVGVKKALMQGFAYSGVDYATSVDVRQRCWRDTASMFQTVDAVLLPTTASAAISFEEFGLMSDLDVMAQFYTGYASFLGLPAVSLPAGLESGLPVAAQLIGAMGADELLLDIAVALQEVTPWHRARAPFERSVGDG